MTLTQVKQPNINKAGLGLTHKDLIYNRNCMGTNPFLTQMESVLKIKDNMNNSSSNNS